MTRHEKRWHEIMQAEKEETRVWEMSGDKIKQGKEKPGEMQWQNLETETTEELMERNTQNKDSSLVPSFMFSKEPSSN